MVVNYNGKKIYNICPFVVKLNITVIYLETAVIYHGILTLENVSTAVNYRGMFITFAPEANPIKLFTAVVYENL